jgi:hypothetical protein
VLASVAVALLAATIATRAADVVEPICALAIHEESLDLEDAVLDVQLYRSTFAAYTEIYEMIAALEKDDAIDRMTYLRARYDRDAAKLDLERADLQLIRQEALIEQLRLACAEAQGDPDEGRTRQLRRVYLRYRQADCDQQAKAIEIAKTNLEFNKQWLAGMLDLRQQVSTQPDVIRARLDVTLEEQRRDDASRRTAACREALKELQGDHQP